MNILYICSAGARRSETLSAYSNHYARECELPDLRFSCAGMSEEQRSRDEKKKQGRLDKIESVCFGTYAPLVQRLRSSTTNVHPRMGVLLLEDHIDSILDQRMFIARTDILVAFNLLLPVDTPVQQQVFSRTGIGSKTVLEYLDDQGTSRDINEVRYILPFTRYQLAKDRTFRDNLKTIARNVVRKVASTEMLKREHSSERL